MEREYIFQSFRTSLLETCTTTDETPATISENASFLRYFQSPLYYQSASSTYKSQSLSTHDDVTGEEKKL